MIFISGQTQGGEDLQAFSELQFGGSCQVSTPPSCTAVSTKTLKWQLHDVQSYYLSVKVTNIADRFIIVTSPPYTQGAALPSMGIVLDVAPENEIVLTFGVRYNL